MDQNNQNEPVDVAALAAQVAQGGSQQPQPGDADPGVDPAQVAAFNEQIAKYTNGAYEDFDTLKGDLEFKSKYEQLLPQYKGLEATANVDPFANDLAKRVNQMFAEGADRSSVKKYVDLHFMDIEAMDGLDVIAHEMAMGKIPYTPEQIKFQLEKRYPMPSKSDYEDDEAGYNNALRNRQMQIDIDSKESAVNLQGMMSDMGDGKVQQQQQQDSERRAALMEGWSQVGASLSRASSSLSFSMDDAKRIGGKYDFEFKPKDVDHDLVSQVLAEQATAAGLQLTKDNIPKLQEMHQSILWNLYRKEFQEALASDMYATLQQHFVRSKSSASPPKTTVPTLKARPQGKFPRAKRGGGGI